MQHDNRNTTITAINLNSRNIAVSTLGTAKGKSCRL